MPGINIFFILKPPRFPPGKNNSSPLRQGKPSSSLNLLFKQRLHAAEGGGFGDQLFVSEILGAYTVGDVNPRPRKRDRDAVRLEKLTFSLTKGTKSPQETTRGGKVIDPASPLTVKRVGTIKRDEDGTGG
jgi:hypothetical protein